MNPQLAIDLVANPEKMEAQLKRAHTVVAQANGDMKALREEGARLFDSTRTPLERYTAGIAKLQKMMQQNIITTETHTRATKQLNDEFLRASGFRPPQSGGAGAAGNQKGLIDTLKRVTGKESTLGNLGKIIVGTGAVAGVGLLADKFEQVTAKAVTWREELQTGAKTMADIEMEAARSVPIFGDLAQAALNIYSAFKGDIGIDYSGPLEAGRTILKNLHDQNKALALGSDLEREKLKIIEQEKASLAAAEQARSKLAAAGQTQEAENIYNATAKEAALLKTAQLAEAEKKHADALNAPIKALEDKLRAMKMNTEELLRYELAEKGLSAASIEHAVALQKETEAIEKNKKATDEAIQKADQQKQAIDSLIESLKAQNAELQGKSAADQLQGADDAQRKEIAALEQQNKVLKDQKAARDEIGKVIEANLTTEEKHAKEVEKLYDLLAQGLPMETFDRALAKLNADLASAQGAKQQQPSGPVFEDPMAAFRRIAESAATRGDDTPNKQLDEAKRANEHLARSAEAQKEQVAAFNSWRDELRQWRQDGRQGTRPALYDT